MNDTCNQPLAAAYSWGGDSTAGIANQVAGYVNEFPPADQEGGSSRKRRTRRSNKRNTRTRRNTRTKRNTRTRRNTGRRRNTRTRRRLTGGSQEEKEKELDSQGAEGNYDLLPDAEEQLADVPEEGPEGYMQEEPEDGEYNPEQIMDDLAPVSSSNSSNTDTLAEGIPSGDMDELPPMKPSPKRKRTTSSSTLTSSTTSSSTTRSQRPKKKSKTSSPNKSAFTFRNLTPDEKKHIQQALKKYRSKKSRRKSKGGIRYKSRKKIATNRPRVKGRFIKTKGKITSKK